MQELVPSKSHSNKLPTKQYPGHTHIMIYWQYPGHTYIWFENQNSNYVIFFPYSNEQFNQFKGSTSTWFFLHLLYLTTIMGLIKVMSGITPAPRTNAAQPTHGLIKVMSGITPAPWTNAAQPTHPHVLGQVNNTYIFALKIRIQFM
jgi:hypothetical protein